jgi:hypothetical protein
MNLKKKKMYAKYKIWRKRKKKIVENRDNHEMPQHVEVKEIKQVLF